MSTVWAAIAAAQLVALGGGQLASKLGDDEETPAAKAVAPPKAEARKAPDAVPSPMPVLLPPLPLPATFAAGPAAAPAKPDRFVTVDGATHVGHVLREIEGGFEFEDEKGNRYPIALSAVKESERGEEAWKVPAAAIPKIDEEAARRALTIAFDVYELEQARARLTYGEKALVTALGLAALVVGFAGLPGDTGKVVGTVGAVGAGGGGIALGVTALRSWSLSRRAEEGRAQLKAMGAPANARAAQVSVTAVAARF